MTQLWGPKLTYVSHSRLTSVAPPPPINDTHFGTKRALRASSNEPKRKLTDPKHEELGVCVDYNTMTEHESGVTWNGHHVTQAMAPICPPEIQLKAANDVRRALATICFGDGVCERNCHPE